jgi:serine/threonine-protein phosphatase 5
LEPKNEEVKSQLLSTQKLVRKIEFEKAIEVEGEKDPTEACLETIANGVSLSYCTFCMAPMNA